MFYNTTLLREPVPRVELEPLYCLITSTTFRWFQASSYSPLAVSISTIAQTLYEH